MREEVSNWFKQAKKDLSAARNSLNSGDYEWASFQANQSAEKALKALYLIEKKGIVPSHNLVSLGKMLSVPENLMNLLKDLNPEYTLARYPDAANAVPFEIYTEEKAKSRIINAEEVLRWVEKRLS
ncbi:HEPN domain-containing protein [Candidatus Pacearchaeota archaeon]|nr:HEPN domain-containing protein [Candidatus Pacearchaeota archaeon]